MESIYIGESPSEESCEQLGPNYDKAKAIRECRAFISQIRRVVGEEPPGARLYVRSNAHDHGTYQSVECKYDPSDSAAVDYAFKCESVDIEYWDDVACVELQV